MNGPLLILGCSQDKTQVKGLAPFIDIYNGPIWKQVKANYSADRVAAISAKYGVLAPLEEIEPYDEKMDEAMMLSFVNNSEQMAKLVEMIEAEHAVIVFGGETYKLLSLFLLARNPHLVNKVRFACGSYLIQRKAMKSFLDYVKEVS